MNLLVSITGLATALILKNDYLLKKKTILQDKNKGQCYVAARTASRLSRACAMDHKIFICSY